LAPSFLKVFLAFFNVFLKVEIMKTVILPRENACF
jgi:hypothetical protein